MSTVVIPRATSFQLQGGIFARNGKCPDAAFQRQLVDAANHCARYRVKELARFVSPIANIPAASSNQRFRFACHTSPFAFQIHVRMILAPSTHGVNPTGRLTMVDGAAATIGIAECRFGRTTTTTPDTPAYFGSLRMPLLSSGVVVTVPPSTDLFGLIEDVDGGRIVAATVYEVSFDADTDNGYLPGGFAQGTPIYDEDRGDMVELARDLWKRGASPLWNWSSNTNGTAPVTIDNTYRNIVDDSSTAVSASTPGATFVLGNRSRLSLGTVPCVMKVYAKSGSGSGGSVRFVDSAGAVKASCATFGTTASWVSSGAFYLPASTAKYDLHYSHIGLALGVQFTCYAVSIYQYET